MKYNNVLRRSFVLVLTVVAALFVLHAVPQSVYDTLGLKKVDMLSDVKEAVEEHITEKPATEMESEFKEKGPEGVVMMENFASRKNASKAVFLGQDMMLFYKALYRAKELGRPVRIAYFGDSFIEGDILTQDLRQMLQAKFGGMGVGWVDVEAITTPFRGSVKSENNGFGMHKVIDRGSFDVKKQYLSQYYFDATEGASVTYSCNGNKEMRQDRCSEATFFFAKGAGELLAEVNGKSMKPEVRTFGNLCTATVKGDIYKVKWSLSSGVCYGCALDPQAGIVVDNYSMRGVSGTSLTAVGEEMVADAMKARPYDLIVLAYGLNYANSSITDYSSYQTNMQKVVHHLAKACPEASVLIIGVSDRAEMKNGVPVTAQYIKDINKYQRKIAFETGCAYWDQLAAMGKLGGIVGMADKGLANKDYIHTKPAGGKKVAEMLYRSIVAGYDNYVKRQ